MLSSRLPGQGPQLYTEKQGSNRGLWFKWLSLPGRKNFGSTPIIIAFVKKGTVTLIR